MSMGMPKDGGGSEGGGRSLGDIGTRRTRGHTTDKGTGWRAGILNKRKGTEYYKD